LNGVVSRGAFGAYYTTGGVAECRLEGEAREGDVKVQIALNESSQLVNIKTRSEHRSS
jgi:hypothetical protein